MKQYPEKIFQIFLGMTQKINITIQKPCVLKDTPLPYTGTEELCFFALYVHVFGDRGGRKNAEKCHWNHGAI